MRSTGKRCLCGIFAATILGCIGFGMVFSGNFVFRWILRTQLVLSPTSSNFAMWQDLPMPIKTSMYLFNVTNPDEIQKSGAKPKLVEVGPFVFDEYHKKVDLVWNDDNGTVTYKQVRTFFWRPDESAGNLLNDSFVILNIPAATVGATAAKLPAATRWFLNIGISALKEKLFVKKTAAEILFDGYKDPVLDAAEFIQKFNIPVPGIMDKFGFYYGRNGSDWWDGVFNMYTGASDVNILGQVATWNYSDHLDVFPGSCGKVEGVGDFFSPNLDQAKSADLYSNDLCRPIVLNYSKPGSVKGVPGFEYRVAPTYFGNSSLNAGNWCFEGSQLPSGVYNASACRFGAPIFMSQPHFYQADPYFSSLVEPGAMKPNATKHETAFVIEPQSGIPISVKARFQVNVLVDQLGDVDLFKHVPRRTFFPVIWFESKFDLADSLAGQMWLLSHLTTMLFVGGLMMLSFSVASFSIAGVYFSVHRLRDRSIDGMAAPILTNETLEDDSEQENKAEEEEELKHRSDGE